MSKLAELRTKYGALIAEAKKLTPAEGAEMNKETSDKINALLGQADEVKVQIEMLARVEAGGKFATQPTEPTAAHMGWRTAGPDEGAPAIDAKAFREFSIPVWGPYGIEQKSFRYFVPLNVQGKDYAS